MDPHQQGPSIQDVLRWQDVHRSSLLWDAPLEGEAVPGVLNCRHREKGLLEGGVDPRIATYITAAGLDGLLRVPNIDIDHSLITALVERWRPETHSFHLPHGEMTITLQDVEVIMGVPVAGLPVVGYTGMNNWGDLCAELLGHMPPDRVVGRGANTAVLEGARVKAKWLEDQFRNPLPADTTDVLVQQYARFYILEMLAGTLFMDKFGERHSLIHLCKASEKTAKQISSAVLLVQLWAWVRFPHICPVMRHPHQALPLGPLAIKWKGAKITTEHPTHVLHAYRMSLASLRPNQVVWEPYRNYLDSLPAYCTAGQHIWRSVVPLIHFWVVEGHHPERVLRQFGIKQGIPDNIDNSIELHKITLQGKHDKNWVEEHAAHIAEWAAHAKIVEAPPFHGEMSYNDKYMVWFRPRTVESQLKIMAKCELRSEIYTDCINALQAVEELGRLTLDDARAVGNTSVPTIRPGRQAGGRQGQGGRHQSSQCPTSGQRPTSAQHPTSGRRHTPVPTSSRRHAPVHDHTMEEASQTADEMCLDTGYDMGSMAHDDAGPSHTFVQGDTSRSPSTSSSGPPLPTTCTSPPPTTSIAGADVRGRDEMRFLPTPGAVPIPTPPPHQRLHTLRIGREGRNGHGHILLIVGLDMLLIGMKSFIHILVLNCCNSEFAAMCTELASLLVDIIFRTLLIYDDRGSRKAVDDLIAKALGDVLFMKNFAAALVQAMERQLKGPPTHGSMQGLADLGTPSAPPIVADIGREERSFEVEVDSQQRRASEGLSEIDLPDERICPTRVSDGFFESKEGLAEWKAESFETNGLGERVNKSISGEKETQFSYFQASQLDHSPYYNTSGQYAWQTLISYDACIRLCLNAWARGCTEAPEFLQPLSCLFQLKSATEDTGVEPGSAIFLRPGSGDCHVFYPESQGDALLVEVQDAKKSVQGRTAIPVSSLTDNPVRIRPSSSISLIGIEELRLQGPWKWLLTEFADYYGVSDSYTKLRYLSHVMNVVTPTKDCLELVNELLVPIIKARSEKSLTRQEVSSLLGPLVQLGKIAALDIKAEETVAKEKIWSEINYQKDNYCSTTVI
ncbi:hypothetical protein SO802_020127 [Lithocarpus litseifolius]|uniref:Aminotransferase-like plant mobile domain-containing protein n=1 Tax=Lithocarpus litseifolius TaxID=425828 RepID=A0AAW2CCA7_9ROSI